MPLGQAPETTSDGRPHQARQSAARTRLERGDDGLFRMKRRQRRAGAMRPCSVASGALESSNVNIADAMVNMIELARHFDLQVKAIRTAEENGAAAAKLLQTQAD